MAAQRKPSTFKSIFGQGLAILLPSIVTLWLLWQASMFVFNNVAVPINRGLRGVILWATPIVLPAELRDEAAPAGAAGDEQPPGTGAVPQWYVVTDDELAEARADDPELRQLDDARLRRIERRDDLRAAWEERWYLNLTGLFVAVLLIYLAGRVFGNYLGREIYSRLERLIARIPGFKQVYPHVKQVVDLIFGENSSIRAFREAVLVQYPREGLWTIGLVTGESFGEVRATAGEEVMSIFIPTSPTPMTGFVINVPKRDVVPLDISIEQAIRFVVTAGVLTPDNVVQETPSKGLGGLKLRRPRRDTDDPPPPTGG